MCHIRIYNSWGWLKTTRVWQETHLHVRSVLCHLRPERAYRFLLLLLFLLSMSSLPIMSGKEHRGVDMSLTVSLSGREDAQMTNGVSPCDTMCEEESTEHPCLLEPSEPLHDSDRMLDPLFGVQFTRVRVGRREVAISAQPILDTHTHTHITEWLSGKFLEFEMILYFFGDFFF